MIIEKSNNLAGVLKDNVNPLLKASLEMARYRLETEIAYELLKISMRGPTAEDINAIIDGLPEEVLCQELAKRM